MNLLELQRRMAEDVMRPLGPGFRMQSATDDGRSLEELADSYIKPNALLSSFDRLEIYNRQYWFRVVGAVAEDYPGLHALLGDKKFDNLVLAYLRESPSTSFTLRNLGSKLPQWLEAHPELALTRHELLVDVARLEWAYIESFDRASFHPLSEAEVGSLTADSHLLLQPHLQLLDLRYPVEELILAVHRDSPPAEIVSNAASEHKYRKEKRLPRMRRSGVRLAVHRFENCVYYRRLDYESFILLSAIQSGERLGRALEIVFSKSDLTVATQTEKIRQCFSHASELGWFCRATDNEMDSDQ
jgi:hypothetical protein